MRAKYKNTERLRCLEEFSSSIKRLSQKVVSSLLDVHLMDMLFVSTFFDGVLAIKNAFSQMRQTTFIRMARSKSFPLNCLRCI